MPICVLLVVFGEKYFIHIVFLQSVVCKSLSDANMWAHSTKYVGVAQ